MMITKTRQSGQEAVRGASTGGIVLEQPLLAHRAGDEWLLTNGLGGYAMGTPMCGLDRRYHAWLVAALTPPVGRFVALTACSEWLVLRRPEGGRGAGSERASNFERIDLSTFSFASEDPARSVESPHGASRLERFERTTAGACIWTYRIVDEALQTDCQVTRTLFVHHERNACSVSYSIAGKVPAGAELEVRPLTGLRDFHQIRERQDDLGVHVSCEERAVRISHRMAEVRLALRNEGPRSTARFVGDSNWWQNFCYRKDAARGQAWREHVWSPGYFAATLSAGQRLEVVAAAGSDAVDGTFGNIPTMDAGLAANAARLQQLVETTVGGGFSGSATRTPLLARLVVAADQFVVRRLDATSAQAGAQANSGGVSGGGGGGGSNQVGADSRSSNGQLTSIIAGYPWFSDWGRDTFIALPGLLLTTGRSAEALEALRAFAALRRRGLIPNCFDNISGQAEYNTADASLWFVIACCRYVRASGDVTGFDAHLRRACLDVIEAYRTGTDFHIRVDPKDGLVAAGDASTQLTWMDARRDGVVFTPRAGKPVEINALWYNALLQLGEAIEGRTPRTARELTQLAQLCGSHFESAYWDTARACLHDVAYASTFEMRPNQIFAISLEHSPVSAPRRSSILEAVRHQLIVKEGVRTLAPDAPGYQHRFEGSMFERDRAYHNGTVWPWLLGACYEALMRVNGFSPASRETARMAIENACGTMMAPTDQSVPPSPLMSLCEVLDAEEVAGSPRRPEGCPMQAWSVAELLRVLVLSGKS